MWLFLATVLTGCGGDPGATPGTGKPQARPISDHAIVAFCSDCHLMPNPLSFPKERWKHEVEQGIRLYHKSGRDDLIEPDFQATLEYFNQYAPETYEFPQLDGVPDTLFKRSAAVTVGDPVIAISSLGEVSNTQSNAAFVYCDMWRGNVGYVSIDHDRVQRDVIGHVAHPSHVQAVDFDQDGLEDYLVTDLGSLSPQDTNEGSLWWLRGQADGEFKRIALRLGLSRTADVETIDYDDDGDLDLVVGDFGLHFVGSVYLVENQGFTDQRPKLNWTVLDDRPGIVEIEIADIDSDGRQDIVTLVSQHHESLDVRFNRGGGLFELQNLFEVGDPASGSSGFELADMDADGDLDVVLTCGDTFDDNLTKPFHAIYLLTNQGDYPFDGGIVASMPGVYCATIGDLDLDGDLDIAAVSLLSTDQTSQHEIGTFDGVIWLEQTETPDFVRHIIDAETCNSATCRLLDVDGDGDLDLYTPHYAAAMGNSGDADVFINQTR